MKFFSTFSSLFLMRLLESRPWWGPEMAGLLKCSLASYPKAMVCTQSTEWCLRSHLSNSAHVSRLRVFVEMAFKGSQPCASNQDSSPGHSHRNSDNTMNHGTSGESQQNKRWDGIIWLSHTPCHTVLEELSQPVYVVNIQKSPNTPVSLCEGRHTFLTAEPEETSHSQPLKRGLFPPGNRQTN